jgi:hypothetical protein
MSVLECSAEPTDETMPSLKSVIVKLEALMLDPWEFGNSPPLRFTSLLDRLEAVAGLNSALTELERHGLALFGATSSEYVKVPRGQEEGIMAISSRQNPQYAVAARFHIAEYSAERLRLPADVVWPLKIEFDDDIPF